MKNRVSSSRKFYAIVLTLTIILSSVGISSYFLIYSPHYEAERTRLLMLTTDLAPVDLDPAWALDVDSYTIILNVFDRLVQYKEGSIEIEPSLAMSWDTPDAKTYIFTLKEGVYFHDSTPFNATSVKFSIDRAIEMGTYIGQFIENVEVMDTYKVKITLYEDFAPFLQVLASPAASIVSQDAVEILGDELFNSNPVGTGPFKYDSWDSENGLVLTANQEYFEGPPKIENLDFKAALESSERISLLLKGDYDAVLGSTGLQLKDIEGLEENPDIQVSKVSGLGVEFLGFNMLKEPLNDISVREAISYAIDYDAIINDVMAGVATRNGGPIPPSIFGYTDLPLTQRDTNKAKQLLSEAGYPDGFSVTLTYNIDNLDRRRTAEVIRDSLGDVGITVRLQGLDWDSALDEYLSMEYEMCLNIWLPDYLDADSYLTPQFHSSSLAPNGANIFGLSDPAIDELIDQARSTSFIEARKLAYKDAQQLIVEKIPAVFLYVPDIYNLVRYDIGNWIQSPTGYFYAQNLYRK
jgi:peptide/nickel transport system substrate-binding protein